MDYDYQYIRENNSCDIEDFDWARRLSAHGVSSWTPEAAGLQRGGGWKMEGWARRKDHIFRVDGAADIIFVLMVQLILSITTRPPRSFPPSCPSGPHAFRVLLHCVVTCLRRVVTRRLA